MSYAQGFEQMRMSERATGTRMVMAQIWRAGCIIRAQFLQNITDAFTRTGLKNLLDDYFKDIVRSTKGNS